MKMPKLKQKAKAELTSDDLSKRIRDNVNYLLQKRDRGLFTDETYQMYTMFYRVRKNNKPPTLNTLIKVCNNLGVDIGALVGKDLVKKPKRN
jgi:hypothetical protein